MRTIDLGGKLPRASRFYYIDRPGRLMLDIETPAAMQRFEDQLPYINQRYTVLDVKKFPSFSEDHWHVFVFLPELTRLARPARYLIQVNLGSDITREIMNYSRFDVGLPYPELLQTYEKPHDGLQPDYSCRCELEHKGEILRACYHLRKTQEDGGFFGHTLVGSAWELPPDVHARVKQGTRKVRA